MDTLPDEMWTEVLFQVCGRSFPLPTRLDPARDGQLADTLAALPGKDKRLLRAKAVQPLLAGFRRALRALLVVRGVSRAMNQFIVELMPRIYPVLHAIFLHVERRTNLPHCAALRVPLAGVTSLRSSLRWHWAAVRLLAWPMPTPKQEITLVPVRPLEPVPGTPKRWFDKDNLYGTRTVLDAITGEYRSERIQHTLTVDRAAEQLLPPYVLRLKPDTTPVILAASYKFSPRSPLLPLLEKKQPLPYALFFAELNRGSYLNAMSKFLWQQLDKWGPEPPKRKRKRDAANPPLTPEQRADQLLKRARYE